MQSFGFYIYPKGSHLWKATLIVISRMCLNLKFDTVTY